MSELEYIKQQLEEMKTEFRRMSEMLSPILVSAEYLTKVQNLNENTISRNDSVEKYNQIGKRKLLLTLDSVPVIKNRKKRTKRPKTGAK